MWLHNGLLHLVVNMVSLLIIGCHVERVHGCLRTGLVYITTGIVGSIGDFRTLISIRRRLQYSCRFVGGRGERHPHEPGRARSASHIMVQGRPPCGYSVMDLKRRCSSGRHRHITQLRIRSMHVQFLGRLRDVLQGAGLPQHRISVGARRQPSAVGSPGHDSAH